MTEPATPDARWHIPRSESEILAAAAAISLPIPDPCMAGVVANLALLASHADRLFGTDAP